MHNSCSRHWCFKIVFTILKRNILEFLRRFCMKKQINNTEHDEGFIFKNNKETFILNLYYDPGSLNVNMFSNQNYMSYFV